MNWPLLNSDWNYWPERLSRIETWRRCAALGFAGIEIGVYGADADFSLDRIQEYRDLGEQTGVPVRAVLFSLPPERWPEGAFSSVDHAGRAVKEAIELGKRGGELGLDFLGIWPGGDIRGRAVKMRDAWSRLVESVAEVDYMLAAHGVRTALEFKPLELLSGPDAALRLCESVKSDSVGVILDTGHSLWALDDLPVVVDMLGARLFHVHLGDTPPGAEGDLPPGRRHNFAPFFAALSDSGYSGLLSLDMYGSIADGFVGADEASEEARRYVESCTQPARAAQ